MLGTGLNVFSHTECYSAFLRFYLFESRAVVPTDYFYTQSLIGPSSDFFRLFSCGGENLIVDGKAPSFGTPGGDIFHYINRQCTENTLSLHNKTTGA